MKVLVYNTDGVNPYSTEIAALLADRGEDVELLDTVNGQHRPPEGVRWRRLLPANFGSDSPVRQVTHLARGLGAAVWAALARDRVIVVSFARFAIESAVFGALAALGRPVVVVLHNPVARRAESAAMGRARRFLLGRADSVVIHAERLRDQVERVAADRIVVCPHPPYHVTAMPEAPSQQPGVEVGRRWVAFVGALRWDKGVELLLPILERVPEDERQRIGVLVCGMGSLPEGTWQRLDELGYATCDLTSASPVPQEQMLAAFAGQPVVLAPYVAATQSGSVILALTMGCRVVAFDEGGIPDVLSAEGLVPSGDLDAMARAITDDRGGHAVLPIDQWVEQAAESWGQVVSGAGRVPRTLTRPSPGLGTLRRLVRGVSGKAGIGPRALVRLDRGSRSGHHVRFEEAVASVVDDRPELVSVDIVDTVLTRRVLNDHDVAWIVGKRLAARDGEPPETAQRFVSARRAIAAQFPLASLGWLVEQPSIASPFGPDVAEIESDVEASLLRPVPGAAAGLRRLRAAGIPLVFVTDMHLPRELLWSVLSTHGLATDADDLVISSELGRAKSSGGLFDVLRPTQQRVVHIGNDLWSDVAMAEAAGVRGVAVTVAEPTRSEAVMGRRAGSVGTVVAAAARHGRLAQQPTDGRDAAVVETGALGAQCFAAFLLWAREQCLAEGITDVGFLARDGELPLRMAEAMPADHWKGVRLRYLELAGRRAWTVAAAACLGIDDWLAIGNADDRAFIHTSRHLVPFSSLLERIALRPDDLTEHASLAALDASAPLPVTHTGAFKALLADPNVHATILGRAQHARALLVEYLEGQDLGGRRLAFVDVGWRGQLAWMMSAVLRDITGEEPLHLHFGGANVAAGLRGSVDIRRFAVDDSVEPLPFPDVVSCVETFTASGAPRAVGLRRSPTGEVELVRDAGVPEVANAARDRLWRTAIDTAAALPSLAEIEEWGLDARTLDAEVREILTGFWTDPEAVHAVAAAQLGFEVDEAGTVVGPVAARYRLGELVAGALGVDRPLVRQWRQGSLRLTPPLTRPVVVAALRARDARNERPGR